MRELLGAHDVANTVRMARSQFPGAFVLVEGAGSDLRFYNKVIDRQNARSAPAHSKENLYDAILTLEQEAFPGILGIADADRDRLLNKPAPSPNILLTDSADLESMLILSPALEKVLLELGSESKIQDLQLERSGTVRDMLFTTARPLGALRLISERENLNLKFQGLRYDRFVDKDLLIDTKRLLETLRSRSSNAANHDWQNVAEQMNVIVNDPRVPSSELCNGHDLVAILGIGLTRIWGSRKAADLHVERLESLLRVAYERRDFANTGLYSEMVAWQDNNPLFRICHPSF